MKNLPALKNFLIDGLHQLNIASPLDVSAKLFLYLEDLEKWNEVYNLSGIHDPHEMITHHLLDSLAITHYLQGEQIIDVGTGAGLPGIPLAIANPQKLFTLLDSRGKRTRFLQQVIHNLQLKNVTVVQSRVEAYRPEQCFHSIITRAFASLRQLINLTAHLRCENGVFLAMKGQISTAELEEIPQEYKFLRQFPLEIPHVKIKRVLVVIGK